MSAAAIRTTVVGSYPRPLWLSDPHGILFGGWHLRADILSEGQDDATVLAIRAQERLGLDLISDGEQRRDSFVFYFSRRLGGFDFEHPVARPLRGSRHQVAMPRIVGPVRREQPLAVDDVRFLRANTDLPIKAAIAGPMTLIDTSVDEYYRGDRQTLAMDLAAAINAELREWVAAGCDVVQIDEPAFTRYPAWVRQWGLAALARCLQGITARTAVHVCYGYPSDGTKVREHGYEELLPYLVDSGFDLLSLECAAPHLNPSLLKLCRDKEVIFGVIDIGSHQVEDPERIRHTVLQALDYIAADKLWLGPDCGLVLLDRSLAYAKLAAMAQGARLARQDLLAQRQELPNQLR
ncbi:MAG TPA: hypothetical protein VKV28_13660 [Candidatus Binataceae bacterium]|nr:hypothetical protein [Candidatus Binataceae bacterium]